VTWLYAYTAAHPFGKINPVAWTSGKYPTAAKERQSEYV